MGGLHALCRGRGVYLVLARPTRLLVACLFAAVGWLLDWHSASFVVFAKGGSKPQQGAVTPTASGPSPAAQRPISTANTAARAGGGISPEFLAGVVGRDVGSPGAGLNVLGDIQAQLSGRPAVPSQQQAAPPGIDPMVWEILQSMGGDGAGNAGGGAGPGGGQGVGGTGVSGDTG